MAEFDWNNYLEVNSTVGVPEELFSHVEASLNNGITQGMLLEVCHKNNPDIYWIAEIKMVCGQLLRIKFIGAEEEFCCNISTTKVHPLGWCGKYEEQVEPPEEINEKYGDKIIEMMKQALVAGQSVSIEALNNKGLSPRDRIKVGMKVEVRNIIDPYKYWIATVCDNVGGRLLLRYDGADEDLTQFWIFYTNPRLSSFGYVTNKGSPWQLKYPGKVNKFSCKNKLSTLLRQSTEESIKEPLPADLFQSNQNLESHNFVSGMKLEALDPQDMKFVRPATVTKVFNNFHFLVVIDDHIEDFEDTKMAWLCDSMHPYIYPIGWAQKNGLSFKSPKIWKQNTFDWDEYLTMTSSVPAPEYCFGSKTPLKEIEVNMKLEAVNPQNHEDIHVANVVAIAEHMLCVELLPIGERYWYAQDSDLLLPIGWADSNDYALHVPRITEEKKPQVHTEEKTISNAISSEEWCDRIYFNYKCYAGPSISRSKLSQLPKHVGPGPLSLVIKEVLNKIISASYKPAKLLRDLETEGPPEEGMQLQQLKAKLKSSTQYALVAIPRSKEQLAAFCRAACRRLQACPSLFAGAEYPAACPAHCTQQDKATFHNNTERRGRPKGSLNGRRKKKKAPPEKKEKAKEAVAPRGSREGSSGDSSHSGRRAYPKLEMKTRGAKLPNFALQMKQAHWQRKDVQTTYSGAALPRRASPASDERSSSRVTDGSDADEPDLKRPKLAAAPWTELRLATNPLEWSVDDLYAYLVRTRDCRALARRVRQEEIDGEAFAELEMSDVTDFLHVRREYAVPLGKRIDMIRQAIARF